MLLDARDAAKDAERYRQEREAWEADNHPVVIDGLPSWSEASPGVSTATRWAELDQLAEHAHHVDEVARYFADIDEEPEGD